MLDELESNQTIKPSTPSSVQVDTPTPVPDPTESYLTGSKLYVVLAGISLAVFLFALDISVISTAIPAITVQFKATTDIGWYAAAYPLCLCALQPLSGKIYVNFSLKWAFCVFVSIFIFGSLLCAVATSSKMFISARAVTGVGAAGIFSGSFSILAAVTPLSKRALYISGITSLFGIATISGPILGGALTTKASWRWCFYINLPVGAVTLVTLVLFLKPPERATDQSTLREKLLRIDIIGCAMFIPTIVMTLLAVQWGGHQYPWNSATVVGLLCGSAGLLAVFLVWEHHKGDDAMIPFSILLNRSVLLSCFAIVFIMGTYLVSIYYIPEWFQVIKGATPLHSGVMSIPALASQVIGGIASGLVINRTGYHNPWFLFGTALLAISSGLYTTLTVSTGHAKWITYLIFQGVGATCLQSPIFAVQAALISRPAQIPVGISTIAFFQYFGASLFQSIALAIFQNQLVRSLKSGAGLDQAQVQLLLDAGSGHARKTTLETFPDKLPLVIGAYNKAITDVFYTGIAAAVIAFFLALGVEWKDMRASKTKIPPKADVAVLVTTGCDNEKALSTVTNGEDFYVRRVADLETRDAR